MIHTQIIYTSASSSTNTVPSSQNGSMHCSGVQILESRGTRLFVREGQKEGGREVSKGLPTK